MLLLAPRLFEERTPLLLHHLHLELGQELVARAQWRFQRKATRELSRPRSRSQLSRPHQDSMKSPLKLRGLQALGHNKAWRLLPVLDEILLVLYLIIHTWCLVVGPLLSDLILVDL
jgi:hypothetical protein